MSMQQSRALAPETGARTSALVARQPILDRQRRLHGYELLYRCAEPGGGIGDGERATASVLTTSFLDIGSDQLLGRYPAFINATREFLLARSALALPADSLVIEILEDVHVDEALVRAVRELRDAGYRIALDDFVYRPAWEPLLALAQVVKIDVLAMDVDGVREQLRHIARYDVQLLAEKVETAEQFRQLLELGFHLFQGYFFAKPAVVTGARVPASRLALLRLVATVQDPAAEIDAVAALVSQDPSVSFRLMRFINSAAVALPMPVTSIQRAVVYVGQQSLRRWVTLIALSSMDDKPTALTRLALARARMCERLLAESGRGDADEAFTVGLFSTLDAFMDQPLADVLATLPLSGGVRAALLDGEGPAGEALACVGAYERGEWPRAVALAGGIAPGRLGDLYCDAAAWADTVVAEAG